MLFITYISTFIFLLFTIAFFTLLERKILSSIQRRRGPNIIGIFGLLQPFADGFKLIFKEILIPQNSIIFIFIISPIFSFLCTLLLWIFIPFKNGFVHVEVSFSILFILAISSLSIYGIIFSGWASNSKYAFLGSIRSSSQMISYELCISTIFASIIMLGGSFSIIDIVERQSEIWFFFPLIPFFLLFLVTSLAETNRTPFDLPEAEAELVAGYNVEYSAIMFALFFLAEYGNILFMCTLSSIFFFGGWTSIFFIPSNIIFSFKIAVHMFFFIWIRAIFPRYRYDQLMQVGWKILLPLSFSLLFLEGSIIWLFETLGFND